MRTIVSKIISHKLHSMQLKSDYLTAKCGNGKSTLLRQQAQMKRDLDEKKRHGREYEPRLLLKLWALAEVRGSGKFLRKWTQTTTLRAQVVQTSHNCLYILFFYKNNFMRTRTRLRLKECHKMHFWIRCISFPLTSGYKMSFP